MSSRPSRKHPSELSGSHGILVAIACPLAAALLWLSFIDQVGIRLDLVWILALVPAFVFTGRFGWKGALAAVVYAATVAFVAEFLARPYGRLFTAQLVVLMVAATSLGGGRMRERWAALLDAQKAAHRAAMARPMSGEVGEAMADRTMLDFMLQKAVAGALREPPLMLVLFSADRLVECEELYGEEVRDHSFEVIARALFQHTRRMNVFGHYDDNLFMAILQKEDALGANAFARRILEECASADTPWNARMHVSAGLSLFVAGSEQPESMLEQARRSLEKARELGGDTAVTFEAEGQDPLTTPGLTVLRHDGRLRELHRSV